VTEDIEKDLDFTHSIINYINATYQGRFAYHTILLQLQQEPYVEARIDESKEALARVTTWLTLLWERKPIFSFTPQRSDKTEGDHALELLVVVSGELEELATRLEEILLESATTGYSTEHYQELLACFARFAYSRDNYLRGFVDLAKFKQDEEIKVRFEDALKQSDEDIQLAHTLLKHFKANTQNPGAAFNGALYSEVVPLAGIFRSYVHDIRQLLGVFGEGFSYDTAGISEGEARVWKDIGIEPIEAGYWLAYGLDARAALKWSQLGVTNYRVAGLWQAWGFQPEQAIEWQKAGYIPRLAGPWIKAGFELEEASKYINKGITLPELIPPQDKK